MEVISPTGGGGGGGGGGVVGGGVGGGVVGGGVVGGGVGGGVPEDGGGVTSATATGSPRSRQPPNASVAIQIDNDSIVLYLITSIPT